MKTCSEKPYLRTALLMSVRPALEIQSADTPAPAQLRLEGRESLQAYVMVFFREFLSRFCRGQSLKAYANDDIEYDPLEPESEHPEITLARYICNLQQEIFRRGRMGVPIRWLKRMSYSYKKAALLQRSFMWLLYFSRMRVRGKPYSTVVGLACARHSMIISLSGSMRFSATSRHSASHKPP